MKNVLFMYILFASLLNSEEIKQNQTLNKALSPSNSIASNTPHYTNAHTNEWNNDALDLVLTLHILMFKTISNPKVCHGRGLKHLTTLPC